MKTALITIIFLFVILFAINYHTPLFNSDSSPESLKEIFQQVGICLNVDEQTWKKNIKHNQTNWRYFCDTNYFKIHRISKDLELDEGFLLEAQINHGSGEYDNYIVTKVNDKYSIMSEFKGYFDTIIYTETNFKFIYSFGPDQCKVLGHFDGQSMVTDSVLTYFQCSRSFVKGQKWE